MPGGRVYVSRKMVAFLRNEDELAGLLGHELGHLAARQQAMELSRDFRDVLGPRTLSPDEDLLGSTINLLKMCVSRRGIPSPPAKKTSSKRSLINLACNPSRDPATHPRRFQTCSIASCKRKGKTGNWFTDLFGATHADSRRLREALKDILNLPASCIEAKASMRTEEFHQWQAAVLRYRGIGHTERLSGIVSRKQLNNPLRGDIENFHFSPDGKYLLAQDEGGIYVLAREPLKFVFRIESAGAQRAQFSPDSRQVVFFSSGLRVETWDVETQEQSSVTDVPALHGCRQTELSPDARYLACLDNALDLSLFNVASGEVIFKERKFFDF